jgi:hypothetical protein
MSASESISHIDSGFFPKLEEKLGQLLALHCRYVDMPNWPDMLSVI